MKKPATYIMSNKKDGVLYIGVSSELKERVTKHKSKTYNNSFTARYNLNKLVWFEYHDSMHDAIKREKQLKAGSRKKKIELIEKRNPEWKDLYNELE